MYGGEIFKLTPHSERLKRSANLLDFEIPYSVAEIDAFCKETCAKNGLTDCYVRPVAYLGPEQTSVSALNNKVHLAIAVWDWPSYFDPEVKARGLRLEWSKWRRPDPATAPTTAKAAGLYMICTMSKHAAEAKGCSDAMMFDYRGYVAEATGANIFFIKDGEVHTPIPDAILNGITRQTVIGMLKDMQIKVHERRIEAADLEGFEQCFLTGTAAEVTPVGQIGDYNFEVGELTKRISNEYERMVRA